MAPIKESDNLDPASNTSPPLHGPRPAALRAPLATILGHTQYLKRCFLSGRQVPPDDYLAAFSAIERSVWALEGHLRVLENEYRRPNDTDQRRQVDPCRDRPRAGRPR
jgi:hypothetical protein